MKHQFYRADLDVRPFPERNSHMRALHDAIGYVDEAAPNVAADWLAWLATRDDPDFDERASDYDYVQLVYSYDCCESEALRLARRWLWDQIEIQEL